MNGYKFLTEEVRKKAETSVIILSHPLKSFLNICTGFLDPSEMSVTVKQIGQVSAQLKSQIEQFQQSLDQNDVFISQLKEHVCISRNPCTSFV